MNSWFSLSMLTHWLSHALSQVPLADLIGFFAGILTTISFLPQVIKVWKTRNVEGLSVVMYSIYCSGVFSWLVFGIFISSFVMIFFNMVTLLLALSILIMKLKYDKKRDKKPSADR